MRNGNAVTIATDPLLNISEQTVDSRGNITLIRRLDNLQRELTRATYRYNPLGEMLAAFDADGNPLTVEYDRLGRRIRMTSADIGTKNWQYDPSGNLIAEWDSQLASLGRRINYTYDGLNRLTRINYPFSEDTVYEYGTSDRTDSSAGRVTKLIDETGFTTYTYGMLGQVEEERRTIKLLPLSSGLSKEAVMRYTSDYLGRMQEIVYPDGERLRYEYNYGGQIVKVTGIRQNTTFNYVNNIGYDEYSQRVYIEYGSGVKSYYSYDEHRRWLSTVRTENQNRLAYQNLSYEFDAVGNVLSYTNTSDGHTTTQTYSYDGLYQLIQAQGSSISHPYGPQGVTEYTTTYKQDFTFNRIGNMTNKLSESMVSTPNRLGDNLNYNLDYDYIQGTRKASRIGNRHYSYDLNGNLIAERDGSNAVNPEVYRPYYQDGDLYWTDYGFGVTRPQTQNSSDGVYQRNYRWNERNLLSESSDSAYTVQYRYGADGQRAVKYVLNNRRSTLYFNRMWQTNDSRAEWVQSKHIYLGEQRILTKYNSEGNNNTQAERERIYYYHSDHLGSAQTITNHIGQLHERIEYTPYGELWIDWKNLNSPGDGTPFRFTGKELDEETGLYYYGARYLDPRISRWLSVDPAMYEGDYLPSAPNSDEARQRNQNLPGVGGIYNYVNMHVYHYAGNNPVRYIDPDGRWGEYVHYTMTIIWAREVDFCVNAANILAKANYGVDKNPDTSPVCGNQSYHFNTNNWQLGSFLGRIINAVLRFFGFNKSKTDTPQDSRIIISEEQMTKAIELYKNDNDIVGALIELGIGLHALQDIDAHGDKYVGYVGIGVLGKWSHYGAPFLSGVPLMGYLADDRDTDPARFDRTWRRTNEYLRRFRAETGFEGEL
ncbi:MAG: hypothetical protein FWD47_14970 [Treponema sp.]|nr:hypothetical protein [Treponema sp.]